MKKEKRALLKKRAAALVKALDPKLMMWQAICVGLEQDGIHIEISVSANQRTIKTRIN